MSENRVKISSIILDQFPEFVLDESPLVIDFIKQYYFYAETNSGGLDILNNIDKYVSLDKLLDYVENTYLTSDVLFTDNEIFVESTEGFPDKNGLILINDEVILYGYKTSTSFLNCTRGFSGVISYEDTYKEDQLVFKNTNSIDHSIFSSSGEKVPVKNLSLLFLKYFLYKSKKQFLPGLEETSFYEGLNEKTFTKKAINFYQAKSTEESFRILFLALYGKPSKIILPRDNIIQPSDSDYRVTQNIVVESISGNIESLVDSTLYQDELYDYTYARATISDIEKINVINKNFYILKLDFGYDRDIDVFGTIKSKFKIHSKTLSIGKTLKGSSYIDVDSTLGFPDSGQLIVTVYIKEVENLSVDLIINYTSKNSNQFLGCTGIDLDIESQSEININHYAYGYDINNEIIKLRITGILSGLTILDNNNNFDLDDEIDVRTLGENSNDIIDNSWVFNVPVRYSIKKISETFNNNYEVQLYDDHNFLINDRIELIVSSNDPVLGTVNFVSNNNTVIVKLDSGQIDPNKTYFIKKSLLKFSSNDEILKTYNANVQNCYVDYDNNTYVLSSSLPYFDTDKIEINTLSNIFESDYILDNEESITITDHFYSSGDSIVIRPGNSDIISDNIGLTTSVFFVKKIDLNTIKLSRSRSNLYKNNFIKFKGNLKNTTIEVSSLSGDSLEKKSLKSQNLFKKFQTPIFEDSKYETRPGTTGLFVNGVELLNYKSNDKIFYGSIENIEVTSPGRNYDVITPPKLTIIDELGENAKAICSVLGNLKKIDIINSGFDYLEVPQIKISGGNGVDASAICNLTSIVHKVEFNSSKTIVNNELVFLDEHKFRPFEAVIYETKGQKPIQGLLDNTLYYCRSITRYTVKLYKSLQDAQNAQNEIVLSSPGVGYHTLRSTTNKNIVTSVKIISEGRNYQSKKRIVNEVFPQRDILIIKNHGYLSGERIVYTTDDTPIVGLTTGSSYLVTKISNDEIKLSQLGPNNNENVFYSRKEYVDIGISTLTINHYFDYEPITLTVSGQVGIDNESAKVVLKPIFRGQIESVCVESKGTNYGSPDIVNYNRQPSFILSNGYGAQVKPIISENGSITSVLVQSSGINYFSSPDIIISGDGVGAILTPVVEDGILIAVNVISGGVGYKPNNTKISILDPSQGANFEFILKRWTINLFEKYSYSKKITQDDGFVISGFDELQYVNLYPPRKLRSIVYGKNFKPDLNIVNGQESENLLSHSPIIGWAYDGNPIYGPNGYSNDELNSLKFIKSSYELVIDTINRPSVDLYPPGYFIEDYVFTNSGDLDEFNGRYCKTPEFPEGTYAYFCTFSDLVLDDRSPFNKFRKPQFPYVIGNSFNNVPIKFNFNLTKYDTEGIIYGNKLLRNTTPYKLINKNSFYDYIYYPYEYQRQYASIKYSNPGVISDIEIVNKGDNYKVNDQVVFDTNTTEAVVKRIDGKNIVSINSDIISYLEYEFIPYNNFGDYIGISTIPHGFYDNTTVKLNTRYEYEKFGKVSVIEDKLFLTKNVGAPSSTGIVTFFSVYGNDLGFPLKENDYYKINNEIVKILNIDPESAVVRVLRNQMNTVGSSHSAGDTLLSLSRKVVFNVGLSTNLYSDKFSVEYYFDPSISVGVSSCGYVPPVIPPVNPPEPPPDDPQTPEPPPPDDPIDPPDDPEYPDEPKIVVCVTKKKEKDCKKKPKKKDKDCKDKDKGKKSKGDDDKSRYSCKLHYDDDEEEDEKDYGNYKKSSDYDDDDYDNYKYKDRDNSKYKNKDDCKIEKGEKTKIKFKSKKEENDEDSKKYKSKDYEKDDSKKYKPGDFVNIKKSSNSDWDIEKVKVISVTPTYIEVDYDTSALPELEVDAIVRPWISINIPIKTIYLPGHNINTGDCLIYNSNGGDPLSVSTDRISSFPLPDNSKVYAAKIDEDYIGISTNPLYVNYFGGLAGVSTFSDILYFCGIGTGSYHSFKTCNQNILTGKLFQANAIVTTDVPHELELYDYVKMDVDSNIPLSVKIIYDDTTRRFLVNPKEIEEVNILDQTITITKHRFKTGEKVLYISDNVIGGMVNYEFYYIVIIDENTIKLSSTLYDSKKDIPVAINITSIGDGTLSLVNPEIRITKYQDIVFDLSSSTLSTPKSDYRIPSFDLEFFGNRALTKRLPKFDMISSGVVGITSATLTLPSKTINGDYYYTLVPIDYRNISEDKKKIYIDDEQINFCKITLFDSEYSGVKKVIDIKENGTKFSFALANYPEETYYDQENSTSVYSTDSLNPTGPINSLGLLERKKIYKDTPYVKEVKTNSGSGSYLVVRPLTVDSIQDKHYLINNYGFNYSSDFTLRPKANAFDGYYVETFYAIDYIDVISPGVNYKFNPKLILIDGLTKKPVNDTDIFYDLETNSVIIKQNTRGINKLLPSIVPVENDNGFIINSITFDPQAKLVTVILDTEFNTSTEVPFKQGDFVIIEDVQVFSGVGYNSSDYDYAKFIIQSVTPNLGSSFPEFTFSLDGILPDGENPGEYNARIIKGRVIPEEYTPKFDIKIKPIDFVQGEIVYCGNNYGVVKSWDKFNSFIKVKSDTIFDIGSELIGQTSNIKARIIDSKTPSLYYNVDSSIVYENGWYTETGKLNDNTQRIHDNDYYQYFSYSVSSEVDYSEWSSLVDSLNHTAGFKKFGDLIIESSSFAGISEDTDTEVYSEDSFIIPIDVNTKFDFDLVTENSFTYFNRLKSNEIYFNSVILTDYIESINNKVLNIDDISSRFSNSEVVKYQIIDEFNTFDILSSKYIVYIRDSLDPSRTSVSIVNMVSTYKNSYINNYSVINSEEELGYFDANVLLGKFAQLQFYPFIFEQKIYDINIFGIYSSNIKFGVSEDQLNIGDIASISNVSSSISSGSTEPISIQVSNNQNHRACKILLSISSLDDEYRELSEINILNNNGEALLSSYGDVNTSNDLAKSESGISTYSAEIVDNKIILNLHPSNVSYGSDFNVNASVILINSFSENGAVSVVDTNILRSNFISTSFTGGDPEELLVLTHSISYESTYNVLTIHDTTNDKHEFLEIVTHLNNTNQESFIVVYGNLNDGSSIGQFSSRIDPNLGDFELYFQPYEDISYNIKILTTLLSV